MRERRSVGCSALVLGVLALGSPPAAACYLGDCDSLGYYETSPSYSYNAYSYTAPAYYSAPVHGSGYVPVAGYYAVPACLSR